MPAPIPPPPPQASPEETRRAVRLARTLYALAILFFLGMAATYSPSGFPVDEGRDDPLTWVLWSIEQADVDALRAEGDGRIAWLVGASILREAVDTEVADQDLPIPVVKLGFNRGASGLAAGLLARIPLQPGDVVVHNVAANNFRQDWIAFVDIPHWWLTTLFSPAEFWGFRELSVQDRLEGSVNYAPRRFWTNHEDTQEGWFRAATPWLEHRSSHDEHVVGSNRETTKGFTRWRLSESAREARELTLERWDASPDQFNVWGLSRMKEICDQRGATLLLVEVPPTDQMVEQLFAPEIPELWVAERERHGIVQLEKVPDADYADFMHPNPRGRVVLTEQVVELISSRL